MWAQGRDDIARALLEGRARVDDEDKVQTLATKLINPRGISGTSVFGTRRHKQICKLDLGKVLQGRVQAAFLERLLNGAENARRGLGQLKREGTVTVYISCQTLDCHGGDLAI
jgi:hypothetical protein